MYSVSTTSEEQTKMSSSSSKPQRMDVVKLMMQKENDVTRTVLCRSGSFGNQNVTYHVFRCPRGVKCKKEKFRAGTGYSNPYKHLLSWVASNNES